MKAFVINLPRSQDRRAHIEAQLERVPLEYEIVTATDGRTLSPEDLERLVDPAQAHRAPRWLRPNAVGACLSHFDAYRRVLSQGLDSALVLEDDVVLTADVAEILDLIAPHLDCAEIALLYYGAKAPCRLSDQHATALRDDLRLLYPIDLKPLNGGVGYVITPSACRNMIEANLPIKSGADSWYNHHESGALERVRCVYPRPFGLQTDFQSTLDYSDSVAGALRITTAITRWRVFPFHQMLARRRAAEVTRTSRFSVTSEASPYRKGGTAGSATAT